MNETSDPDLLLLERYVAGECTPAERAGVETWMQGNGDRAAQVEVMRQVWTGMAVPADLMSLELAWELQRQRLVTTPVGAVRNGPHFGAPTNRVWWFGTIAAVLIVAFAIASLAVMKPVNGVVYATLPGQREMVRLPDGTQLTLAPASSLKLASDYGAHTREVALDGEAYFTVVHNAQHPFSVLARNVRVTDVGTEFDVRGYDDDIRVAVSRGSVVVGEGQGAGEPAVWASLRRTLPNFPTPTLPSFQDISLSAGDMVEIASGIPSVTHHASLAATTAWMQGNLVFDATPLRKVVLDLGRTYGVTIAVADSGLLDRRITTTLSGQTLDMALTVVTGVVGARFEQHGQQIIIRKETVERKPADSTMPLPLTTARAGDSH